MVSKTTEQKDKLTREIIISVVLHVILFAMLIWRAFAKHIEASAGGGSWSAIDAVMVDPDSVVQHYDRQHKQQQASTKLAQEQSEELVQQQLMVELREKQAAEQEERLKQLEKERFQLHIATFEQTKQQSQPKKIAEKAQEQQKQAKTAVTRAEKQAAGAAVGIRKKVTAEIKKQLVTEVQKITVAADVDDLLENLISYNNAPRIGSLAQENDASPVGRIGSTKNNDASGADISNYAGQIKAAIESHFYDASSYAGKTCTLRIKLAPDGMLLDIKSESGDPTLCTVALAAARQAKIPKPPSQAVYEVFKDAPLDFRP